MSRDDLVELAALDVFGLLDDYESALYTRSFHHAPAAVQDELLELQAELAADPILAPEVLPPAELREQVLGAVSRAIESEHSRLAPIASIGGNRAGQQQAPGPPGAPGGLRRLLFGASGQFWRAAAFALCGAVIVLAYFQTERDRHYEELLKVVLNDATQAAIIEEIGPEFTYFMGSPAAASRSLRSNTGAGIGLVMYEAGDSDSEAFVLALGLPRAVEYAVRIRHADGHEETLDGDFRSNGTVGALKLGRLPVTVLASATIEVVNVATGAVVMTT